ncbi:spore coat putative kinase YutH [Alkalicoccobacillus porphyridii]|uniref:spore coat putative kinase YutH n=1 Tax=Alkalicoccobacillus porphyridii TaxID=2597270 RepID=UPI00163D7690|nr:spore coat protein YutH [Alkalicoccobacillus porphyridii]
MFERNIYDSYRLYSERRFKMSGYECFEAGGTAYILFPRDESASDEQDILAFVSFLREAGDSTIPEFVPTVHGAQAGLIEGVETYLCKLPHPEQVRLRKYPQDARSMGEELAAWHEFSRPIQSKLGRRSLVGQWGKIWTTRLEQLEDWYEQLYMQGPSTVVDEAFLTTYPYFMGLSENAIQYAVDTDMDGNGEEHYAGTLCHRRFSHDAWIPLSSYGGIIKPPTSLIYDHPARDLAEWLRSRRSHVIGERSWSDAEGFLQGYQRTKGISSGCNRLIFARLLYPVHYFEVVEDYYRCQIPMDQQKLGHSFLKLIEDEKTNEQFLYQFAETRSMPNTPTGFPRVDWL